VTLMINENTKIRLSLLISMAGGLCTSLIWVGSIQADVTRLKSASSEHRQDNLELSKKVDSIKENTDYMRGLMDSKWKSK